MIVTLNLTFVMVGATPCGRNLGNVKMLMVSTRKSVTSHINCSIASVPISWHVSLSGHHDVALFE